MHYCWVVSSLVSWVIVGCDVVLVGELDISGFGGASRWVVSHFSVKHLYVCVKIVEGNACLRVLLKLSCPHLLWLGYRFGIGVSVRYVIFIFRCSTNGSLQILPAIWSKWYCNRIALWHTEIFLELRSWLLMGMVVTCMICHVNVFETWRSKQYRCRSDMFCFLMFVAIFCKARMTSSVPYANFWYWDLDIYDFMSFLEYAVNFGVM